jgi:hypothetical protein
MKNKSHRPLVLSKPSESDIRDYAYHLYKESHCVPGRDLENWLEATACLQASIPSHRSPLRLHQHINDAVLVPLAAISTDAGSLDS